MSKNSVTMFSDATGAHASNIASSKSWGAKRRENLFINSFVGSKSKGVSYVKAGSRGTIDQQGEIVNTSIASDIAIEGNGMMVVADSENGNKLYTRRGDFRQDEFGFWKNGADMILFAWKLDKEGNKPLNASLPSALESVNFANTKGDPVPTTAVSVSMNLNAKQEAIRGPGPIFSMQRTGINESTGKINKDDILFPEKLSTSGIMLGDTFTFTSTPPGTAKTIEFGGIAIANTPSTTTPIFGAQKYTDKFTFDGTDLAQDHQLKISVDGLTYTFTAVQGTASPEAKTFNSIQTLASAINKVSSLKARINPVTGTLYIAPKDANSAIVFADGNGGSLKSTLGLIDIPAATANTERFNSLLTLQKAVNKGSDTYKLYATIDKGDINITSKLATSDFTISGRSMGVRSFTTATLGDGTEKGRGTVTISAPQNNLSAGDFVRIDGMSHAQVPNGIYYVSAAGTDSFQISLIENTTTSIPALAAAAALSPAAGATWQKVAGQSGGTDVAGTVTATAAGAPPTATITTAGAHGLVANDVVFLSGAGLSNDGTDTVNLPDGYYQVTAIGGGGTTFTVKAAGRTAATISAGSTNAVTFRKIGAVAAGGFSGAPVQTFNTNVFTTGAITTNTISIDLSNHNYNPGDFISFEGLATGYTIDGIVVENDTKYKVTAVTANTVTFEITGASATAGGVARGYATPAGSDPADVDHNFRINHFSRSFEYFKTDQEKVTYDKTYDKDQKDKSLSGNPNLFKGFFESVPVKAYDSLGSEFNLSMKVGKLEENKWAVEISAMPDADGLYDINAGITDYGLIVAGTLEFDAEGNLIGAPGLSEPIQVTRNNGSNPTNITIDWTNSLDATNKAASVTQFEGKGTTIVDVQSIIPNGQRAGTLTGVEVNREGFIVGTFDNGETRKLYQLPVAIFPNVNGLQEGFNGTFEITRESGDVLLKEAGVGGAGSTLGGVLEASNADTTSELLEVQDLTNTIRANARVAGVDSKNINTILSELQ